MSDPDPRSSRPDPGSASEEHAPPASAPREPAAEATPSAPRIGLAARCFDLLAAAGPLTLLVFAGLIVLPGLQHRGLLLPEEQRLETLRQALSREGTWFAPFVEGAPYTDLPTGFLAFAELPARLGLPVPAGSLLPAAAAAALLLFTLSVWGLARAAGNTGRTALAAGIAALTAFAPAVWARAALPDVLFAACVTLSGICFYRAWIKDKAPLLLIGGFTTAVAAFLIRGPIGLGLPLIASVLFLIRYGTFRRAGAWDGAFGFGLMLVLLCAWIACTALAPGGKAYLTAWLHDAVLAPLRAVRPPSPDRWTLLRDLALFCLPWTLLIPLLPWERLAGVPGAIRKNRTRDPGTGWLWCLVLSGLALFLVFPPERPAELLVVLPPLAVLAGRAVIALKPARSGLFFGLLGLLMWAGAALFGLLVAAGEFPALQARLVSVLPPELPFGLPDASVPGSGWAAGICLLFGLIFLFTDTRVPTGALLIWLLFCTALAQPANLLALPALSPVAASEVPALPPAAVPDVPAGSAPTAPDPTETVPALPEPAAVPQTQGLPEPAVPLPEPVALPEPAQALPAAPEHGNPDPDPSAPVPGGETPGPERDAGTPVSPLSRNATSCPSVA